MAEKERMVAAPPQEMALYRKLLGTVAGIEDKTDFGSWPPSQEMVAVPTKRP